MTDALVDGWRRVLHAVLIGTRPEPAMATMRDCADLGIKHVWMHRSFGAGQRFRRGPQPEDESKASV